MSIESLRHCCSPEFLAANASIGANLAGALLLGMLVGYERSYKGRAAGMRTYGLVCMAATALTAFVGFADLWYGGTAPHGGADATRVVQGVVTGIGFLGAGVIVKDGLSIRGLTTAASIWAVAAAGILIGVGFYPAALVLALLSMASMTFLRRLEARLPATWEVTLTFRRGHTARLHELTAAAEARGYRVLPDSLTITFADDAPVWRFGVVAIERSRAISPAVLAEELATDEAVSRFSITPVRN